MGIFKRPLEVLREWTERDDGTLEGPAISTDELNNKPATVTTDDTGEYRMVASIPVVQTKVVSVTSTGLAGNVIGNSEDHTTAPFHLLGTNTNIASDISISFTFNKPADSDAGSARVTSGSYSTTGVSVPGGGGKFSSGILGIGDIGVAENMFLEAAVDTDGNEMQIRRAAIQIWEEIA